MLQYLYKELLVFNSIYIYSRLVVYLYYGVILVSFILIVFICLFMIYKYDIYVNYIFKCLSL